MRLFTDSIFELALIYQYEGRTWAIFKTRVGRNDAEMKAPERKAEPSEIRLTIPETASLETTMVEMSSASVRQQMAKSRVFDKYKTRRGVKIMLPRTK